MRPHQGSLHTGADVDTSFWRKQQHAGSARVVGSVSGLRASVSAPRYCAPLWLWLTVNCMCRAAARFCIAGRCGYGYILGPSPVPPIYLAGSFGLVRGGPRRDIN